MKIKLNKINIIRYYSIITLTGLFIITLVLLTSSIKVHAASDDFYIVDGKLLEYRGNSESVIIPDSVISIGDRAFLSCETLTSITIPDKITSIEDFAFYSCKNLTDITIPDSVLYIGDYAFCSCVSLTKIVIPDSVTSLGISVFSECINLKSIQIPSSVKSFSKWTFLNTPWLAAKKEVNPLVIVNDILIDGSSCKGKITIPDTVISIGDYAFDSDSGDCKITEVTIPATVKNIGNHAFSNCFDLKKIAIPDTVESIGDNVFWQCISLTSVTIPKSVKSIGNGAFYHCTSLKYITIPNSVTDIESSAFGDCISLISIKIPDSVTNINDSAFSKCSKMKSITIPKSVTSLGNHVFSECSSLTKINILNSEIHIGEYAFEKTSWIKAKQKASPYVIINNKLIDASKCKGKAVIPNGVTEITKGAFRETKITSIVIPESVSLIGEEAFYNCNQLQTINIPNGVKSVGDNAFASCDNLKNITMSKSVKQIGKNIFYGDESLLNIKVSVQNQNYAAEGRLLFNKNKTVLISYSNAEGEIKLPEGIVEIANGAFDDNNFPSKLTKIRFPNTLKKLGDYIFPQENRIIEISLPSSLVTFGKQYFSFTINCINIYKANGQVNFISENGALYNSDKTVLYCNLENEDIVVPDSVTTIESKAFPNVSKSITIPRSVTNIGENIFSEYVYEAPRADKEPLYIYGYKNSAIEQYCIMNRYKYEAISFLALDGTYLIKYYLDGGKNDSENPSIFTRESKTIILKNPSKDGYVFKYWYIDIYISDERRGERIVKEIPKGSLGDIELHTKWEKVD